MADPANDSPVLYAAKVALGRNLQLARLAAGITQAELAQRAGIARATVTQVETATGDPCFTTLVKLAEVLGVSPMLLLMGEPELRGIGKLLESQSLPEDMLSPEQTERVSRMLQAGIASQRTSATKQICSAAKGIGLSEAGAAIGASLVPVAGGILGAALGYWMSSGRKSEKEPTKKKKK